MIYNLGLANFCRVRQYMDFNKIVIKKLSTVQMSRTLLYDIARLFATTGFYEKSIRIRNKELDPFERIIEKYILPDVNNINIILYDGEFAGFYLAHLINDMVTRELNTIPPTEQINWSNHGDAIYNFYDVYFKNNEFLIDNMALKKQFQRKGVYSNIIFPILLESAQKLGAINMVLAVFKYQNHDAYKLYLKNGFKQIANLKFQLEKVNISHDCKIEAITEELILLQLSTTQLIS